MNEEEKKAIKELEKRYNFFQKNPLATKVWLTLDVYNLGILLNLIEKLKNKADKIEYYEAVNDELLKEIKELKEKLHRGYREANNYLYFNDNADYEVALWEVIRNLRPDLAKNGIMENLQS